MCAQLPETCNILRTWRWLSDQSKHLARLLVVIDFVLTWITDYLYVLALRDAFIQITEWVAFYTVLPLVVYSDWYLLFQGLQLWKKAQQVTDSLTYWLMRNITGFLYINLYQRTGIRIVVETAAYILTSIFVRKNSSLHQVSTWFITHRRNTV